MIPISREALIVGYATSAASSKIGAGNGTQNPAGSALRGRFKPPSRR
jgi:hypothetical protein